MVGAACSYLLQIEQEKTVKEEKRISKKIKSDQDEADLDPAYKDNSANKKKGKRLSGEKEKISDSDSDSSMEMRNVETMRDDVSWEAMAFGQSMKGSFTSLLPTPSNAVATKNSIYEQK